RFRTYTDGIERWRPKAAGGIGQAHTHFAGGTVELEDIVTAVTIEILDRQPGDLAIDRINLVGRDKSALARKRVDDTHILRITIHYRQIWETVRIEVSGDQLARAAADGYFGDGNQGAVAVVVANHTIE